MTETSAIRLESREVVPLAGGLVHLHRDVGILARDGVRLSCDAYLPSAGGPFPAILEHIPYRKDDLRAVDDRGFGIRFASEGFAYVRLDVRGTGSSAGIATDEYTEDEQLDGVEAVEWIARQPWCTGAVGSWGKSYGGFSALQLATRRPPALRAIAAVYATDDRYTDDMHFSGGALCALELAHYPLRILAMNALPGSRRDNDASEEDLRRHWLERIEATPAWIERWMAEQTDGSYWRNGSVAPAYEGIACPVLIVAGWRDGYRTAMLRLAERLQVEWRLLAGPWMHTLPDRGVPGPRYPFLPEMVGWFQRHLSAGDPPADRDRPPRTVFFLNAFDPPSRPPATVSGTWMGSDRWPEKEARPTVLYPTADRRLGREPPTGEALHVAPFDPSVGATSGNWCPPPPGHGLPSDQRPDESRSIIFTSEPLIEPIDVLGTPAFAAIVEHSGPAAVLAVKLADVDPTGESQLVTSGVLNLSHARSHIDPEPFAGLGEVEVVLQATGWRFDPGHRIRLAVAGSDWPTVWPPPTWDPVSIRISPSSPARLSLPPIPSDTRPLEVEEPPPYERDTGGWVEEPGPSTWRIVTDAISGVSGIEASDASASRSEKERIATEEQRHYQAFISAADPTNARVEGSATFRVDRPGLSIVSKATGVFGSTAEAFTYDVRLEVRAGGDEVARRRWAGSVERRLC